MGNLKISMLGAGSGFVIAVARELLCYEEFNGAEFCMMDIDAERLALAEQTVSELMNESKVKLKIITTTDRKSALENADYVVSACEINRHENWAKDIRIPEKFGVQQMKGENGGPGGLIHALRNICLYKPIVEDMEKICPDAMLMNFTNPMSMLCTYFNRFCNIKNLGFCHQVHGCFGIIAEMFDMEPGDLEVITGGINHLNWLFDIRKRNTNKSFMKEFIELIYKSDFWKHNQKNIPGQKFSLEVHKVFGMYPVGYDDHICEYVPFFWEESEWAEHGVYSKAEAHEKHAEKNEYSLQMKRLLGVEYENPPFPKNPDDPYFAETPCKVMLALEKNTPLYVDAMVIPNNGAISNLPDEAVVDVPCLVVGGKARSVHVGELPIGPMEICRRQITLHEMIARAAHEGDESLAIQAFALDPYVRSITQAQNIWKAFKEEYRDDLTTFK